MDDDLYKVWLYMAWRHAPAFIRIAEIEQQRKYARSDHFRDATEKVQPEQDDEALETWKNENL